jgi:hypothetical protein
VTTIRIAHAEPRPGRLANGGFRTRGHLVVLADDYRGTTVTFSGEIRADLPAGQAGLRLEVLRHWRRGAGVREDHGRTISGRRHDWTTHEVTAPIPEVATTVAFGVFLTGPGRIELRAPEVTGTEVTGTELTGTEATGTKVTGTKVTGTKVTGTKVTGTELTGTKVTG